MISEANCSSLYTSLILEFFQSLCTYHVSSPALTSACTSPLPQPYHQHARLLLPSPIISMHVSSSPALTSACTSPPPQPHHQHARLLLPSPIISMHISSSPGPTGAVDCVLLLDPDLHGTNAVIAAGARDGNIYLWRRRRREETPGRSMRSFTGSVLSEHTVCTW